MIVTPVLEPFLSVRLTRQALSMIVHFTYQERGHWLDDAISLRASYMTTGSLVFDCFSNLYPKYQWTKNTSTGGGKEGIYAEIPIFWVKKALLGHGSTRVMSSNTVCRALNLFKLLYLLDWKHFYRKKLIFEEVALKKWKFLISEGDFRPKFIKMSATSSNINFFQ